MPTANPPAEYFISRTGVDAVWAQWIAHELEDAGFTTFLQDWDFLPGKSFVENMRRGAECPVTIAVASQKYWEALFAQLEWEAAFVKRGLLIVRVQPCDIPDLLAPSVYVDLFGKEENEARSLLLEAVKGERRKRPVKFPGGQVAKPSPSIASKTTSFPGPTQISMAKLPAVSPILIGREAELARLDAAWTDPNVRVISIVAFGGVGKSALAINWWHRNQAKGAAHVLGWSFYSQGAAEDRQASAEPFLDYALRVWFKEEPPRDSWERGERLAECIRRDPTLLILDGLEPIQHPPGPMDGKLKDPGMAALLRNLAAHNSGLCVCTSRQPLTDLEDYAGTGAEEISLEQLTPEAGAAYLRELKVDGTEEELRAASEEFDGHALALTLLGRYIISACDGDIRKRDTIPSLFAEPKKGGHARRIMRQYEKLFQDKPELAVLRMLGLFDRPADGGAVAVLRKMPLLEMSGARWSFALDALHEARLIYKVEKEGEIDCHPLIREHFSEEFAESHQDTFKEAHSRLYDHYSAQAPKRPDTLKEMTPLFYAVYHGCKSSRHQEACGDIYFDRINRGREFYLIKQLGAFGVELSLLANFFESPWTLPASGLKTANQSWLINEAGVALVALGRLAEALEPAKEGAVRIELQDLANAAISFNNLSVLQLALGAVSDSIGSAGRAVQLADESSDASRGMAERTALADAHHQAGDLASAARLFAEAEKMQAEYDQRYPILYSLWGYRYCDFLLAQGKPIEVLQRARQTFEWSRRERASLLTTALEHLSLGRAHPPGSPGAASHLDQAVKGLHLAGQLDDLPRGLLARAANFRHLGDFSHAQQDLDEVRTLATRSGMRLHLTDYHLEQARLYLATPRTDAESEGGVRLDGDAEPPAGRARPHIAAAAALIAETGYHRRDAELADLEKRVGKG
jgi:tetratricopeptide (TPR) repeat protein